MMKTPLKVKTRLTEINHLNKNHIEMIKNKIMSYPLKPNSEHMQPTILLKQLLNFPSMYLSFSDDAHTCYWSFGN